MCGIAGYVGKGDESLLRRMIRVVGYRGPDDSGVFVRKNVGLAQTRLSVIDLSPTGHQPMSSGGKTVWLVFNGEIYNFKELKMELLKTEKYTFKSQSDTEVIIYGYEEWGESVFEKLNGMFAVALYDFKNDKLVLARDRMGEKPLYWGIFGETLVFGSEIKSLLAHSSVPKEIDTASLGKYFFFEYVPSPHSIFKGIQKIKPGHLFVFRDGKMEIRPYWKMKFGESNGFGPPEKELAEKLESEINRSVKMRLVSDVPLGVFLSGGIDSSTVAYFAQKNSARPIKTFSIGFEEKSYDESEWARLVAKRLGTEHHEKIFSLEEVKILIPEVFGQLDEPLADASILPTYLLSKMTREKVTVALGGDGGDEFWLGYPTFSAHKFYPRLGFLPSFAKTGLKTFAAAVLPVSSKNFSVDFKINKFLSGLNVPDDVLRNQVWLSAFAFWELPLLFRPEIYEQEKENILEDIERTNAENPGHSRWQKLVYAHAVHYLADGVLAKVDRASMMNSLEVRSPLLDHELVSFVNSLPDKMKFRKGEGKYLLRRLMGKYIGEDIVHRKKKGFGIPVAQWLKNGLKRELESLFSKERIKAQGIFNYEYVNKLLIEHAAGKRNHRQKLWSLFVFQKWYRQWME